MKFKSAPLSAALLAASSILALTTFGQGAMAQTTPEIVKGNCDACAAFCQKTLTYCSTKKGTYTKGTTAAALKDCINACKSSSEYISRGSVFQKRAMALCIDACNNCTKTCESFKDDNNMKACANECRKCAGNCQKIVGAS